MTETITVCGTDLALPDWRVEHWTTNPTWEEAHLASMHANLREGMVVYDVGAELGDFTALFAKWVGPQRWSAVTSDGRTTRRESVEASGVVPVEPCAWYWPAIRETFEANSLPRPLGSFHGFAADETAYEESPRRPWPNAARNAYDGMQGFANLSERPDLGRITLDDLARTVRRAPDAITVDVEGAEIKVVLGMKGLLRSQRPLLWVSVHAECMARDWNVSVETFDALLESFDYTGVCLERSHEDCWFYWPDERMVAL